MTTETKNVAQQLVDIIMPSNEHARSEAVIRIEAALEAAERDGAEKEREACAKLAESMAANFEQAARERGLLPAIINGLKYGAGTAADVATNIRKRGAP